MTKVPFWGTAPGDPDEGIWDICAIGGQIMPGKTRVTKPKAAREVDTKRSPSTEGATTTDKGAEPVTFDVELELWLPEHWESWQDVRPVIDPMRPNAVSQPLEILHPVPNYLNISEIIVLSIEDDPPETSAETYKITIHCQKYYQKIKETKTSPAVKVSPQPDNWVALLPDEMPNMVETTFGEAPGT
jgi:hypothetical protein